MRWRPALAIALYAVFWLAVLFGYLRVNDSGAGYELLRAAAVLLPAFALGMYVNRVWVVAAGLVFLLAAVLPERSTIDGNGIDVTLTGTYGVSFTEALELIAVTTPWLLLGVAARRYRAARASGARAASEPAAGTPSEARASSAPL
jgi:hypothetical protein